MFIDRIFDSRVDGGIPNLAAAPEGPDTRPLVSAKAAPIISRSSIADLLKCGGVAGSVWRYSRESQLFLTERFPFSYTTADRSITFCSSRMFPGHGYRV